MELVLKDEVLIFKIKTLADCLTYAEPLMRGVSRALVSESLLNFQSRGRPAWAGHSPSTIASYRKQGKRLNTLLQQQGSLKGSVQGSHDAKSASVGAGSGPSADYAAIHQFGGFAGRGRKVSVPARPYLPMDANGNLQPEAENTVFDVVDHYWQRAL